MVVMGLLLQWLLHPVLLLRRSILPEGTLRHRVDGLAHRSAIAGRLEGLDRVGIRCLPDHKGYTVSSGVLYAEDRDG
jgi:hypothetical protein